MKTVIAAVDFSSVTNSVTEAALKLARVLKAKLVILNVVPPPAAIRNLLPAIEDVKLRVLSTGHAADKQLEEVKRGLRRRFSAVEVVRLTGTPVACIAAEARKLSADYIVVGSHGYSAVRESLLGSVASGIVKRAPCPVLVIPPVTARVDSPAVFAGEPAVT